MIDTKRVVSWWHPDTIELKTVELQRFTHELRTGWQRCPSIPTRSVSEASGAVPSLTLRVGMIAVVIVVYAATHE